MKLLIAILFTSLTFANGYVKESFEWSFARDWATYDKELKVYYRYMAITEKAHDQYRKLDRRFNHTCMVKERNLRNFFGSDTVVIALYDIKDCKKDGRNPNW